jgi:hypothetical protein
MSDRPAAIAGLHVDEVTDGLVVFDPSRDRVHYLNGTAAVVFILCNGGRDRQGIVDGMATVFGPDAVSRSEVEACLDQLRGEGVVR